MSEEDNKTPIHSDGWKQWSENAKESMEKLESKVEKLEDRITVHREESLRDVSTLKAKAGIMGMVTGFVVSTVMSIIIGLLVFQLTRGDFTFFDDHEHPHPEQTIGYILPPRHDYHGLFVVMEAET